MPINPTLLAKAYQAPQSLSFIEALALAEQLLFEEAEALATITPQEEVSWCARCRAIPIESFGRRRASIATKKHPRKPPKRAAVKS
jgi:hypothetical protein